MAGPRRHFPLHVLPADGGGDIQPAAQQDRAGTVVSVDSGALARAGDRQTDLVRPEFLGMAQGRVKYSSPATETAAVRPCQTGASWRIRSSRWSPSKLLNTLLTARPFAAGLKTRLAAAKRTWPQPMTPDPLRSSSAAVPFDAASPCPAHKPESESLALHVRIDLPPDPRGGSLPRWERRRAIGDGPAAAHCRHPLGGENASGREAIGKPEGDRRLTGENSPRRKEEESKPCLSREPASDQSAEYSGHHPLPSTDRRRSTAAARRAAEKKDPTCFRRSDR